MHSSLESFYSRGDGSYDLATLQIPADVILSAEDEMKFKYYEALLAVQMERYSRYWANDFETFSIEANEQIITVDFEGLRFSGKIDLNLRIGDMYGPMDHKTSSLFTPEVFAGWNFRFQFLFYAWLLWKHTGEKPNTIWWNGIRKPQLRQKQGESFETFVTRIGLDMQIDAPKYLKRQILPLEDGMLEHFEKRILGPKIARLQLLTQPATSGIIVESLARNVNTSECVKFGKPCEFLPLCKSGWQLEGHAYTARETKHEELEIE
jgi:hypothetical protein